MDDLEAQIVENCCGSLRQIVFNEYERFKALKDKGYTKEEICNHLRKELKMNFATGTFNNYMSKAGRFWKKEAQLKDGQE